MCQLCQAHRKHGTKVWRCEGCSLEACGQCHIKSVRGEAAAIPQPQAARLARAATAAATSQPQAVSLPTAPVAAAGGPLNAAVLPPLDILAKLQELPPVVPGPLLKYVPKALCRRFSLTAAALTDALLADLHGPLAQVRNLLLLNLPALLLRDAWTEEPEQDQADKSTRTAKARSKARARLALAEKGQWSELIQQYAQESDSLLQERRDACITQATHLDSEEAQLAKYRAVVTRYYEGDVKGAAQLLRPGGVHAASERTLDLMKEKFELCHDSLSQPEALATLDRAYACRPARILKKQVASALETLHASKAPGPSGWRNGHLQAFGASFQGLAALTAWSNAWAAAELPPAIARPWRRVLAIPLVKGADGADARPLLLGEVLLKLPSAILHTAISKRVATVLVKAGQMGIAVPGGAQALVAQGQLLANALPGHAFVGLDVANAFGTIRRSAVLKQATVHAAPAVPFLLALWGRPSRAHRPEATPILQRCANSFVQYDLTDGLYQGETWSSLCFALALLDALSSCEDLTAVRILAYIDDLLLVLPPHMATVVMNRLTHALGQAGLHIKLTKCAAWIPACPQNVLEHDFVGLGIQQVWGGLDLLGNALQGDYCARLVPAGRHLAAPAATLKRLEKLKGYEKHLTAILNTEGCVDLGAPVCEAVWGLVRMVMNQTLSFDLHVVTPAALGPTVEQADILVQGLVTKLLKVPLTQPAREQIQLAHSLGGAALPTYCNRMRYAYLASTVQVLAGARQRARLDPLQLEVAMLPTATACLQCVHILKEEGIIINASAVPVTSGELITANELLKLPSRVIEADIRAALDKNSWTALLDKASMRDRARLYSQNNDLAGLHHVLLPAQDTGPRLQDDEWRIYMKYRLGLSVAPAHARCAHRSASGDLCNLPLDSAGDHGICCQRGPFVGARHAGFCTLLAGMCRDAGYSVHEEQRIALWCTPAQDAVIDVEADLHPMDEGLLIDGTIRHPTADHVIVAASKSPGAAIRTAERDKHRRYPDMAGRSVIVAALETFGRYSQDLDDLLGRLAGLASLKQAARGRPP